MEANCVSAFQVSWHLVFPHTTHGSSSLPSFPLPFSSSFLFYFRLKKNQCAFCTCEAGRNVFPHVWVDVTPGRSLRFSCTSCSLKSSFVKNAGNVSWEARRLKSQPLFPVSLLQKGEGVSRIKERPIVILETGPRKPPQTPEETGFSAYQKLK